MKFARKIRRSTFKSTKMRKRYESTFQLQLMESMFELGFLDVSDMRWRAPTKTFRK